MQLYLISEKELRMQVLPKDVSGQYTLEYTADNGEIRPLVRINSRDNQWILAANRHVMLAADEGDGQKAVEECVLKENAMYYLRRDHEENYALIVEPDKDDRKYFMHYLVPSSGIIDVGQANYNQIQYVNPYVDARRHLRIQYQPDGRITVSDYSESANFAYLNKSCIRGSKEAKLGDTIFLFGLKIVLGKDFIAVNNPDFKVSVSLEKRNHVYFTAKEDNDEEFDLVHNYFSSAPRELKEVIHQKFTIENPPEDAADSDTPWIVMLGPSLTMAMGSMLSSVITVNNIISSSGNINTALPSLITSVVMVMGTAVWPVLGRRVQKRHKEAKAAAAYKDYNQYLDQLKEKIEEAVREQKETLEGNNPTLDACIDTILNVSSNLWARSPRHKDFLDVMIGHGDLELDAEFAYPERSYNSEISSSAKNLYDLVEEKPRLENVPITMPLKSSGVVGIIGERKKVVNFSKALLLELTSLHNYEDLKIFFIYNEKERKEWDFVKEIPHLWNDEKNFRYLANDPEEVRNLSEVLANLLAVSEANEEATDTHYLIFAADKDLAERAQAIKEFCSKPDNKNVTLIAMYDEHSRLPKTCSYVVNLFNDKEADERGAKASFSDYRDITGKKVYCQDVISYEQSPEEIFEKMANIKLDSAEESGKLPDQYTFMEMLEIGKVEHLDLGRRWRQNNTVNSLAVPIGIDADGFMVNLDLHEKAHGPHGVIAGMTGSGKSEFVISAIASLAVNYSPEDVAFVLIDFKGGGMADIFKELPHTAGLITNLDGNELTRSFLAIEKELEKRQKLFKEISEEKMISNIDIYKYHKLRLEDPALKPLPHLIIVSDEFAELKQQHRDFMDQLIRIARIGRSLGVHLILATQKPEGVVDDQIKSNLRFSVCLKVQDKADSESMIGRPDATLIRNSGRFYFKVGNNEVFAYGQSPWSGASYEPQENAYKNKFDYIDILNEQGMLIHRESVPKKRRDPSVPEKQIDALVQFIDKTAKEMNVKAEKLWLNPLAAPKDEKKNKKVHDTTISPYLLNPTIGLYDDLANQKHLPLTIPFTREGNALLYGAAGSGKLEFINSALVSIMEHHGSDEVQFYLCDYDAGALEAFADSAYVNSFIGAGDRNGLENMFEDLAAELANRRDMMRKFGGDYQRFIASGRKLPMVLTVLHNYQNIADTYCEARNMLAPLAREGVKYGMYFLVSGTDANSIPYALSPMFKNIYSLRQNNDDQYRDILGKTGGIVPDQFRGRGLVRIDKAICEFQTRIVFEDAENSYEAIQNFCAKKDQEAGVPAGEEGAADKFTVKAVASDSSSENEAVLNNNQTAAKMKNFLAGSEGSAVTKTASATSVSELLESGDYSVKNCPVGREKTSGQMAVIDLTSNVNTLFLHDDLHKKQADFLEGVVDKLLEKEGHKCIELSANDSETENKIKEIWELMLARAEKGNAALEKTGSLPDFEPVFVKVMNPTKIADVICGEWNSNLMALIGQLPTAYHIYFLVYDHSDRIFELAQGRCLSAALPLKQAVVLSGDSSVSELFTPGLPFAKNLRKGQAYLIQGEDLYICNLDD